MIVGAILLMGHAPHAADAWDVFQDEEMPHWLGRPSLSRFIEMGYAQKALSLQGVPLPEGPLSAFYQKSYEGFLDMNGPLTAQNQFDYECVEEFEDVGEEGHFHTLLQEEHIQAQAIALVLFPFLSIKAPNASSQVQVFADFIREGRSATFAQILLDAVGPSLLEGQPTEKHKTILDLMPSLVKEKNYQEMHVRLQRALVRAWTGTQTPRGFFKECYLFFLHQHDYVSEMDPFDPFLCSLHKVRKSAEHKLLPSFLKEEGLWALVPGGASLFENELFRQKIFYFFGSKEPGDGYRGRQWLTQKIIVAPDIQAEDVRRLRALLEMLPDITCREKLPRWNKKRDLIEGLGTCTEEDLKTFQLWRSVCSVFPLPQTREEYIALGYSSLVQSGAAWSFREEMYESKRAKFYDKPYIKAQVDAFVKAVLDEAHKRGAYEQHVEDLHNMLWMVARDQVPNYFRNPEIPYHQFAKLLSLWQKRASASSFLEASRLFNRFFASERARFWCDPSTTETMMETIDTFVVTRIR